MNESHIVWDFTLAVPWAYIQLYEVFEETNDDNVKFVNRPKWDINKWNTFQTDNEVCLSSIQGNRRVQLSYMRQDDTKPIVLSPITL